MKNRKRKVIIIVFSLALLFIIGFFGTLYYLTSTVNNYSYAEKKWISSNSATAIDIYVEPSLPVFSSDGKGVFYEYIRALKEDTGLNFNVVVTDTTAIKLLNKKRHYVSFSF